MNQIRAGAALSYFNLVLTNLLNLLFTPLLLRSLGQSGYGLYSLIGAFVAYMGVLDFGFGNAIVRYVAKFRAQGDAAAEGALLRIALRVFAAIAVIVVGIGVLLLLSLGSMFRATMSAAELSDARVLLALMTANLALSLPLGAFNAVIIGHERFVFLRLLALSRNMLRTALLVTLLLLGGKAVAIVIMDLCLNLAAGLVNLGYVRFVLRVRSEPQRFERAFIREIVLYSSFVFMNGIVDQLFWRIGHLVVGATLGTASVAVFAIAMQIARHCEHFPLAVSSVFLPRVTAMVVSGATPDDLVALFARTARIQLLALCYIVEGFALFGREFIHLWAGPAYASAWYFAIVVMIPLMVPLAQSVGLHVLQAKNKHGPRSLIYLVTAIANALLSVFLVRRWGAMGAALGTAATVVAGPIVGMNLYYHRWIRLDMSRFIRLVSARLVPAALAAVAAGSLLTLVPGYSWPKFFLRIAVFTGLYAGMMGWFGLNTYERGLFATTVGWARWSRRSAAANRPPAQEGASSGSPR